MRLGDKDAIRFQQFHDGFHYSMHVLDMRETIRCSNDTRLPVLALDRACDIEREIAFDGWNVPLVGNVADIGRFDAEHPMAWRFEVRE